MFRLLVEELAPRFDVWDRLPEITAPSLVVTGASDWLHPPASARAFARRLAGAKVFVISGAGHSRSPNNRTGSAPPRPRS